MCPVVFLTNSKISYHCRNMCVRYPFTITFLRSLLWRNLILKFLHMASTNWLLGKLEKEYLQIGWVINRVHVIVIVLVKWWLVGDGYLLRVKVRWSDKKDEAFAFPWKFLAISTVPGPNQVCFSLSLDTIIEILLVWLSCFNFQHMIQSPDKGIQPLVVFRIIIMGVVIIIIIILLSFSHNWTIFDCTTVYKIFFFNILH